mgnify:CR=1 FL=1
MVTRGGRGVAQSWLVVADQRHEAAVQRTQRQVWLPCQRCRCCLLSTTPVPSGALACSLHFRRVGLLMWPRSKRLCCSIHEYLPRYVWSAYNKALQVRTGLG